MSGNTHIFTLSNGLRGVIRSCSSPVEYCGIAVNVGSRDESPSLHGLAHFVEHTIFKGTPRRRSHHIINRMESIGGELNAYTTKEETVVYSIFPAGHLRRAVDLISDLVINSEFPLREINKEREVVCDEIDSYLDQPSEAVYDDFEDLIFRNSSLGHNILGSRESVERITTEDCRRYLSDNYTSSRSVFFYMGPCAPDKVERIAASCLAVLPPGTQPERTVPPVAEPFAHSRHIGSHQAHTVLGARIPDMYSPKRHAMSLLSNILGGPGMNSLLNVELREKRGLVYSVETTPMMLTDCGLFTVYFGCDPTDTSRCRRLVENVIGRMADTPMSQRRLDAARRQLLGQMAVSSENHEQLAINTGRALLYRGGVATPQEIVEAYNAVTPSDLMDAAAHLTRLSQLTLA